MGRLEKRERKAVKERRGLSVFRVFKAFAEKLDTLVKQEKVAPLEFKAYLVPKVIWDLKVNKDVLDLLDPKECLD